MSEFARQLAARHQADGRKCSPTPLHADFTEIARLIAAAHQVFLKEAESTRALSYAAEWVLDNYYAIQQTLRQIKQDLPAGYDAELPRLRGDVALCGYPRIYAVALAILWEAGYQLDADHIVRFVLEYQTVQPLDMGELWALPIMLRLGTLQSIALAAGRISDQIDEKRLPDSMAAYRSAAAEGSHAEPENDDTTVARATPNLRFFDSEDWAVLFERMSLVHQMLRMDPSGVYPYLELASRNQYRRMIERLSRGSHVSEVEIALTAVELAGSGEIPLPPPEAAGHPYAGNVDDSSAYPGLQIDSPRTGHVGYYLIDEGRALLEQQIGYRLSPVRVVARWLMNHATGVYLSLVAVVVLAITATATAYAWSQGGSIAEMLAVWLLMSVSALTAGVGFANWIITHTVRPRVLAKLDLASGIPAVCRTALVVPALIAEKDDIDDLIEQIEQHCLRNSDPQLVYALLTDFADADQELKPGEVELLAYMEECIRALNDRSDHAQFYCFHRRRLWNDSHQKWMGWERKRGKLHEFNRLLRGAVDTSFAWQYGAVDRLGHIRYVITLDADTILPHGSAPRLIGALAHPLNRAVFDLSTGRVVAGYTVLQPRAEIKPVSASRSLFTRVFAGDNTLDLYTLAVSDAYQDFFGAGIFVGKGIYDVDAFERSLAGRVPENTLLSHDLFEGIHGRAALVTDIVVYEDYPTHYLLTMQRSHRWVRGDWQLLPWLFPHVPDNGGQGPNRLSLIDRWKIVDNLRRSLFAPSLLLLLIAGWMVLPGSHVVWTAFSLLVPAAAVLIAALSSLIQVVRTRAALRTIGWAIRDQTLRWLMFLAFLPYESQLNVDAIIRTLVRVFLTRRQMLEWTTAAQAARVHVSGDDSRTAWKMLPTIIFVVVLGFLIGLTNPGALFVAAPFLLTWLLAAELADRVSKPTVSVSAPPTPDEERKLRAIARRTWLFYENYVGPADNWLPPDHFQESPRGTVAHRTSPTNIGLYLLSALTACDFGYLRMANFVLRVRFAFDTMDQLPKYRGHFLNWIDTGSLQPLPPSYVSTVDSGNLAAALIALQQGCLDLQQSPINRAERWQGLLDTVTLVTDTVAALAASDEQRTQPTTALQEYLAEFESEVTRVLADPGTAPELLSELLGIRRTELEGRLLAVAVDEESRIDAETLHTLRLYISRVHQHLEGMRAEYDLSLPWLSLMAAPPEIIMAGDPALRTAWEQLAAAMPTPPRWCDIPDAVDEAVVRLNALRSLLSASSESRRDHVQRAFTWCNALSDALYVSRHTAQAILNDLSELAARARAFADDMDFKFLYAQRYNLFHIGYNIDTGDLDNSYYDLLASEARIASLLAIAQNQVPVKHWLHLARPQVHFPDGGQALLSWSGTMFEYLMPSLLLRTYPDTLFHQTYLSIVDRQIAYGRENSVPWGISESGFYAFDAAMNYQYRAFGVPGTGLRRGLADDLVIAPYASMLALTVRPKQVLLNLQHLERLGMVGRFGLYEAVDFTEKRLNLGRSHAVVRSYMAHHQGMILLAIAGYLLDEKMVARIHRTSIIESVDLLLQEQLPKDPPTRDLSDRNAEFQPSMQAVDDVAAWHVPIDTPMPQVHYLSNGRLSTMITNAGAGYLAAEELRLTRWRADTTLDNWGCWVYVQDLEHGGLWSAGIQPTGEAGRQEEVIYHPHMAEFRRRHGPISLRMEVFVVPDTDVEVRRITISNDSDEQRRVGISSYGEVVLANAQADLRHQAFAKLFVEAEHLPHLHAQLFRRRPRASIEEPEYLLHQLIYGPSPPAETSGIEAWGAFRHSADRAQFLGRSGAPHAPAALAGEGWWAETWEGAHGATLDPIMALGQEVRLAPRTSTQFAFVTLYAGTRTQALETGATYQEWAAIDRAQARAATQMKHELRQLEFNSALFQEALQLLSLALYLHRAVRADPALLASNSRGQTGLWAFGISGDYPILIVHIEEELHTALLQELLQIHAYWRRRGLRIDLVVINDRDTSYDEGLHTQIYRTISRLHGDTWLNQRGGIFVLRRDQLGSVEQTLLETVARVVLDGRRGMVRHHLVDLYRQLPSLPRFEPIRTPEQGQALQEAEQGWLLRPDDLRFDNGFGGFSADGGEYIIYLRPGESTPAPWINVIANPDFGFIASERGSGATWAVNSGENRLTTWRNDPVLDLPAEVIYLRDEETAELWSATPGPSPAPAPYLIRHGTGYTLYEHHSHALKQTLELTCAPDAPVKLMHLRIENTAPVPRRLTVTCYAEWVLGTEREVTQAYIIPEYVDALGALLAQNPYNEEFGSRVAFLVATKTPHGATADRTAFLGRLGLLQEPAALTTIGLSGAVGAGVDPCAALQVHIDLPAGGVDELCFVLGQGATRDESLALIETYRQWEAINRARKATRSHWNDILEHVQVDTPDPAMNLLLNRWLLYQALACRVWGRSALYQSSGAFGFRDQLQDVMALAHVRPDITRRHILTAASHQFSAGDVLHWWHPPSGRGVRTRMTDDLLWLPYVTAHYIAVTGDGEILEELVPFLTGAELSGEEDERYGQYQSTPKLYTLFEHCRRAIERGTTAGRHGIPLIGTGDWNDGMNRVGVEGRGESIWLGWFLHATLTAFADLCESQGIVGAEQYRHTADAIAQAIEAHGWDGGWYRRAYYDDGSPLGSAENQECRIDAIAQSWGVLSRAAEPQRARQAMDAVLEQLVREQARLILLFTPPFDKTRRDPGYIKGYLPGVRENGGQYTHAALWSIWAFAELGDAARAGRLFQLINPILRSDTPEKAARYKTEPYVISADVYGAPPHTGRGGWTWYTGSASWMYRLGLEAILGLTKRENRLRVNPCIPPEWAGFTATWHHGSSQYHIRVENAARTGKGVAEVTLDGKPCRDEGIPLIDDGARHEVVVRLGDAAPQ